VKRSREHEAGSREQGAGDNNTTEIAKELTPSQAHSRHSASAKKNPPHENHSELISEDKKKKNRQGSRQITSQEFVQDM
jgi:hypothetical protein